MKYMLLTYLDENAWAALGEAEQQRHITESMPFVRQLIAKGKFLGGAPLHPTSTATTVSGGNGRHVVTDGPFAETREQLGGYTLIEAINLDEAISIAAGFLGASVRSRIEIRPIAEIEDCQRIRKLGEKIFRAMSIARRMVRHKSRRRI